MTMKLWQNQRLLDALAISAFLASTAMYVALLLGS